MRGCHFLSLKSMTYPAILNKASMRFKNFRWGILLLVFFTSYLNGIAQVDSALSSTGNKQIEMRIDSLAEMLEKQNNSFIFFVDIDFQGQKAYACILKRKDTLIEGEKLLISE